MLIGYARVSKVDGSQSLETRPPQPHARPPGQHHAGPIDPRRGPAGAHRARRADRHHHRGRPPRVRYLRGAGRVRAGADPRTHPGRAHGQLRPQKIAPPGLQISRSSSPASASGSRSVSQDVSSDVRLSITRKARAWRAGMVTTGAAVNPSEMAGRVNGSAVLRCAPALQVTPQARCGSKGP